MAQICPGKECSITCKSDLERQMRLLSAFPPSLFLLPALYAEHDAKWCGVSLWSAGVSCPTCVLSKILLHYQPTCWWNGLRRRKGLALSKPFSSITRTSLCYQQHFQHKPKGQTQTSYCEEK